VAAAFASRYAVSAAAFALTVGDGSESQEVIHTVKAVLLLSNCLSALLGEVLRDLAHAPLSVLFDISVVGQALSLLLALRLPAMVGAVEATAEADLPLQPQLWVLGGCWYRLRSLLRDLWLALRLRRVMWWTIWAVAMNPAHGLALTYWQNLLREKHIKHNHNGYLLASMYLAAALLTAASRRSAPLRVLTAAPLCGSLLLGGVLLCLAAQENEQLPFYCWLGLFQSVFEVTTAVSTYQAGAEVTRAVTEGASLPKADARGSLVAEPALHPQRARLTLLFVFTGILCSLTENVVQAGIRIGHTSMSARFRYLGLGLLVLALLLGLLRGLSALWHRPAGSVRRRRTGHGGEDEDMREVPTEIRARAPPEALSVSSAEVPTAPPPGGSRSATAAVPLLPEHRSCLRAA